MSGKAVEADSPSRDVERSSTTPSQLAPSSDSSFVADEKEINLLYRKLDRRIIPPLWILYFICSAIRSNVGISITMNKEKDHDLASVLGITPKQVSIGLGLFYVCYVVFDLPSNLIMSRLSPRVWMSRIVIAVGVVGACMAAMKAAWSFYLLRLLLGLVIAGMWPGMTYYLSLFYPPERMTRRIGYYFTASQVSAAAVGLVSAGFQKMDGNLGLTGFQWMFLIYGVVGTVIGIALLWWLPERPLPPNEKPKDSAWRRFFRTTPALVGRDAQVHYQDLSRSYHARPWGLRDLLKVLADWRLWPLTLMYLGVVGVGIGVQNYGTVIIRSINPEFSGIDLSLLFAPIWIMDLIAILLITPLADKWNYARCPIFITCVLIQIAGLLQTTIAGRSWTRYGGLLMIGFGLGPTVPITMAWTTSIFQPRHGEVGVAAASALVSGLGNIGSILTTFVLYEGWPADAKNPHHPFFNSNMVMISILGLSIISAVSNWVLLRWTERRQQRKNAQRLA